MTGHAPHPGDRAGGAGARPTMAFRGAARGRKLRARSTPNGVIRTMKPSSWMRLAAPLLVLAAAACSSTAAQPPFEAALPVQPGEPWDVAHGALAKLDPNLRDVSGVGGRTSTARAGVTLAGYRFDEVSIAGLLDRASVRSVTVTAPPPSGGCDKVRDDLLKALGPEWNAGEPRLGAVTATRNGRAARIVCTGAELSLAIVG